ncbi:TonB-dependent siderophore receptor, partial [Flavitalea flava]
YNTRQISPTLRLNESLLVAPQNIQVITGKVLADQQITAMNDGIIRNVSGAMKLEHWGDLYTNINMRGSRASAFRNGMNVITSYWSPLTEDMSFVDHVEFVKGPSGFMMSVGDPAGIYNVVTKKPTGVTKGEATLTLGSYDLYRATVDLDGKLDKDGKLLYRFNLMGQTKNSLRPYEYNNRFSITPVISYQLDEKTILTAEYNLQKVKMSDVGSFYVFSPKGYGVLPRNFTTADPGLDPTYITDQSLTLSLNHKLNDNWKLTVQAAYYDYKQNGSSLWPNFVGTDSMIRSVGIWDASSTAKFGQAYLNGELQTGAVHHRILGGLDASDKNYIADWNQNHALDTENQKFSLYNPSYGNPPNGYPVWDRSKSLAQRAGIFGTIAQSYTGVYLQDELGFFDNTLRLTLAGRYTHVKTNEYNSISTFDKFTPRIGLSVSVDNQTSVYALYDQSFNPQTGFKKDGSSVKPQTGNNMELGLKREWANGKWSTTLSAYRILKNNENSNDPGDPSGRFIVQLGQTRSQGVEFDLRGELFTGLTLTANYALTDSKITRADSSAESQKTIGNKVPGYAKHTANAWINYKFTEGALKGFGVSGGFSFLADRSTWSWAGATAQQQALPQYIKFDGGLFWEQDKLRITCNVFNLADKFLYSGAAYAAYYYWQAEAGRNWRLGVSYRF